MHALKVLSLVACIALAGGSPASAVEVQTEQAARDDCSGNSQAEMAQCLRAKVAASVETLDAARSRLREALGRWNEDVKYARQAGQRLLRADEAFQRYRAAQCAFNESLGGGAIGNALDMRRLACEIEINTARAAQLEQLASHIRTK